jgi:hypothetical protein
MFCRSDVSAPAFIHLEFTRCQWSGSGTVVVVVIVIDLFGVPKQSFGLARTAGASVGVGGGSF